MGCDVRVWRVGTMGIGWIIGSCNRGWGATLMRLKLFGIVLIVLASSTHVASASRSLPAGGQRFQRFQRSENHARARQGSVDTSVDVSVDPNDHTCDDFVHSDDHDHRHYCHHRFLSHHQHIDQDIHKDTSQDTSRDNKPHTSQDTSEDTSQNTSQDTNQDTSHDTSQDKSQAHRDETDESEHPQYPNRAVVVFRNLVDEVVNIMYWNEAQKHEMLITTLDTNQEDNIDTTEGHCFQIRYQHNKTSLRSHQVYGDFDTVNISDIVTYGPYRRPCHVWSLVHTRNTVRRRQHSIDPGSEVQLTLDPSPSSNGSSTEPSNETSDEPSHELSSVRSTEWISPLFLLYNKALGNANQRNAIMDEILRLLVDNHQDKYGILLAERHGCRCWEPENKMKNTHVKSSACSAMQATWASVMREEIGDFLGASKCKAVAAGALHKLAQQPLASESAFAPSLIAIIACEHISAHFSSVLMTLREAGLYALERTLVDLAISACESFMGQGIDHRLSASVGAMYDATGHPQKANQRYSLVPSKCIEDDTSCSTCLQQSFPFARLIHSGQRPRAIAEYDPVANLGEWEAVWDPYDNLTACHQVDCQALEVVSRCEIDRRHGTNLSFADFKRLYIDQGKPVVIQGLLDDWPARTKWTRESLQRRFGQEPVKVLYSSNIVDYNTESDEDTIQEMEIVVPFEQYLEDLNWMSEQARSSSTFDVPYLFGRNVFPDIPLEHNFPHLFPVENFTFSHYFRHVKALFFVGAAQSGTYFHQHAHAYNAVLFGTKQWFLLPPASEPSFKHESSMRRWATHKSAINYYRPLTCTQFPGETLFVPTDWYHATLNPGISVGIAIEVGRSNDVVKVESLEDDDDDDLDDSIPRDSGDLDDSIAEDSDDLDDSIPRDSDAVQDSLYAL